MAIIGSLPYTLTNGTVADATQVMADFNTVVNGVNANGAAITTVQQGGYNYAADTGSVNALVIPMTPGPASYTDGLQGRTKAANTNTSTTVTVQFGSLAAVPVVIDQAGTLPPIGSIIQNMHYNFEYDSTQSKAILLNPSWSTFSATVTLTGMASATTGTFNWRQAPDGKTNTLNINADISNTSNTPAMTITGIPAAAQSATTHYLPFFNGRDNSSEIGCMLQITAASSIWTVGKGLTSTGTFPGAFTNIANKGVGAGTYGYSND